MDTLIYKDKVINKHKMHIRKISNSINLVKNSYTATYKYTVQWNPTCEAPTPAPAIWRFKRDDSSSEVEINTFMFRFTLSSGLYRGVGL